MNPPQNKWLSLPALFRGIIIYLYIPLFLFVLGWLNPLIAAAIFLISFAGIICGLKKMELGREKEYIPVSKKETLLVYFLFALFLVYVGHGDLMPQDMDWSKHHAIYYDLMNSPWPVEYQGDVMLTYYLGQYIVPAAIAKLCYRSYAVLNVTIVIWNALGLLLTYLFLLYYLAVDTKKSKILIFSILIIWGGVTTIGQILYRFYMAFREGCSIWELLSEKQFFFKWLDISSVRIHYTSNYDTLYGAPQHIISPWLSACLFLGNRKKRGLYVLMGLPLLFSASFGFVYFSLLLVGMALYDLVTEWDPKGWIRSILSKENLLLLPLFGVIATYLLGGFAAEKPSEMGLHFFNPKQNPIFYLIFIGCEFLCYGVVLFPRNRRNILFHAVLIELMLIPIPMLGLWNDLCSRGAIPARFILMVMCMEMLLNLDWHTMGQKFINSLLILLLLLSAGRAAYQMIDSAQRLIQSGGDRQSYLYDEYKSFEGYAGNPNEKPDNAYNYYTFDYSESPFYRIARHKSE